MYYSVHSHGILNETFNHGTYINRKNWEANIGSVHSVLHVRSLVENRNYAPDQ